jgi:hypothetical protein
MFINLIILSNFKVVTKMKYIIIAGIVILAVFLAVLSQIPLGIEPLTELYIDNHTSLPKNVYLNKDYNFSFTLHNLEYQGMKYDYTVRVFDAGGNLMEEIGSGSVVLENEGYKTIQQSYNFKKPFDRAKIVVNVIKGRIGPEPDFRKKLWWPDPNYPDEIDVHFWVDEIVQTKIIITPD